MAIASPIKIDLNDLRFHAFHGLYPEEKLTGSEFRVDVSFEFLPEKEVIQNINETIDYSEVFALIKDQMEIPRELLETLVAEMAEAIHARFTSIKSIQIAVTKLYPPIPDFSGNVRVSFSRSY